MVTVFLCGCCREDGRGRDREETGCQETCDIMYQATYRPDRPKKCEDNCTCLSIEDAAAGTGGLALDQVRKLRAGSIERVLALQTPE